MDNSSHLRRQEISSMLKGIERYNPENLVRLELYVEEQCTLNEYDLEANLAILKLYQFNPTCFRVDVVVNILLKALTNLPHSDLIMCKCLIDPQVAEEHEQIGQVMQLHALLESCQFKEFWKRIHSNPETWSHVSGFENSIRNFVCHVINITYQKTEKSNLMELLGLEEEKQLGDFVRRHKWKETVAPSDSLVILNQEEVIKTKNITEKMDFEQLAPVITLYR